MILQALALADLSARTPSTGQYVSIAWSILNIAYTFVSVSVTIDRSEIYRALHPAWYGFVAESKENAMSVALGLFDLGYSCSKLFAVAMLGSVSGGALAAFQTVECAGFLLARIAVGQWRFFPPIGDSTTFSFLVHVGFFMGMLTAPFTAMRGPHYLSPSVYMGFIVWTWAFCSDAVCVLI